jgi:hypothetical protein
MKTIHVLNSQKYFLLELRLVTRVKKQRGRQVVFWATRHPSDNGKYFSLSKWVTSKIDSKLILLLFAQIERAYNQVHIILLLNVDLLKVQKPERFEVITFLTGLIQKEWQKEEGVVSGNTGTPRQKMTKVTYL